MRILQPPELDTDTLSVIEAARTGHEPNEMARARVRKGIEIKLAAGIALAIAPATSAFAGALKVTAAVVAVGSVVGAGVYVVPRYVSKPAAGPRARAARRRAPGARLHSRGRRPPRSPCPTGGDGATRAQQAARRRGAGAGRRRERVQPQRKRSRCWARRTRRSGAATSSARCRCSTTTIAGPGRVCSSQERMVTGILAACGAGRVDTAREDARQFRARWPRSPLVSRVDGSCAGSADPARSTP